MFSENFTVRYSEVNYEGQASLQQILDYFQDVGLFHSQSLGYPVTGEASKEHVWFLIAWDVTVHRRPELCEALTVTTDPYKMKGYYGYRRYKIIDCQGNLIVEGDAIWIFMDVTTMLPKKITPEIADAYLDHPEDTKVRIKRKLKEEGDWEPAATLTVEREFLDANRHVNNTYYAHWAEQLLSEEDQIERVRIEYKQAVKYQDVIHIYRCQEGSLRRFKYVNQAGQINAVIEITCKK